MKKTNKVLGIIALIAVIGFAAIQFTGCPVEDPKPDPDPTVEWKSGDVWLQTKESKYKIDEDTYEASEIKSEVTTEWSIYRYASDRIFEKKYKETQTTGYMEYYKNRNGLIEESTTTGVITVGDNDFQINGKAKNEYDSDTGLMIAKETKINADGVEQEPVVNTITLLSNSGGIKTYKYDDGFFQHEYKIQNGEIIEDKLLNSSGDGFLYILKYSLPTNEVILAKLPDFRLETMTGNGNMYADSYQEVEVVSDSDSTLVIRVKTFEKSNWGNNSDYELDGQSDFTYTKFTFPFNTEEE